MNHPAFFPHSPRLTADYRKATNEAKDTNYLLYQGKCFHCGEKLISSESRSKKRFENVGGMKMIVSHRYCIPCAEKFFKK